MTQIIGFAGKKQSGKNTCCNFLVMLKLIEHGACKHARLNDYGEIEVSDIFGEKISGAEWFAFKSPYVNTQAVLNEIRSVRIYAFADALKRMAIDILGLPEDKVYGTDKDKNQKTNFLWQDMPGNSLITGATGAPNGFMTIREVLQFVGTDIFRKIYPDVWIDTLIRKIKEDNVDLALICDVRFENEINSIKKENGIVIGLNRDIFKSKDSHSSEQINLSLCDALIDNSKLTIPEQNNKIYLALKELKCRNLTDLGI